MKSLKNCILEKFEINKNTSVSYQIIKVIEQLMNGINCSHLAATSITIDDLARNFNKQNTQLSKLKAISIFEYERNSKIKINHFPLQRRNFGSDEVKEYGNIIIVDNRNDPVFYINVDIDYHGYRDNNIFTEDDLYFKHKDKMYFLNISYPNNDYKLYSAQNINKELN